MKATEPYQIFWNFEVKVYPDFRYNVYTGWLEDSDFLTIQQVFNKKFLPTQSFEGLDRPTSNKSATEQNILDQEIINWFSGLGSYPYNKDKIPFLNNQSGNLNINVSKITPRRLANWYKANQEIDIFEDNIAFNLKKPIQIIQEPIEVEGEEETSQELEQEFIENLS